MLDQQSVYFLQLLSQELHNTPVAFVPDGTPDWKRIYQLSRIHYVSALLYQTLSDLKLTEALEPALEKSWAASTVSILYQQVRNTASLTEIYDRFLQAGIRPLVVKGLVSRSLYKHPDLRVSSDEDLLVPRQDFYKADAVLQQAGYVPCQPPEEHLLDDLQEITYKNPATPLVLEMHINLFGKRNNWRVDGNTLFEHCFQTSQAHEIDGRQIFSLSHTDHALFLLLHLYKHLMVCGAGIRQILDFALYARRYGDKIDWAYLIQCAKHLHAYKVLQAIVNIIHNYFHVEPKKLHVPPSVVDPALDPDPLLEDMLTGGVYGHATRERLHASTLLSANFDSRTGKLGMLFPGRRRLVEGYPYVSKHPYLLPVAWMHRAVRFLGKMHRRGMTDTAAGFKTGHKRLKLLKKYDIDQF